MIEAKSDSARPCLEINISDENLQRYFNKIEKSSDPAGCWLWKGGTGTEGYGLLRFGGKPLFAHRAAWLVSGKSLPLGQILIQSCVNKLFCNPEHLMIRTKSALPKRQEEVQFNGKILSRFWRSVNKQTGDGCWNWIPGAKHTYGRMKIYRVEYSAHRIAYHIQNGNIPEGLLVCHRCDNPRCVRGDHLFIGTYSDNSADMVSKDRQAIGERTGRYTKPECTARGRRHGAYTKPESRMVGEKNGTALLKEADIPQIRQRYDAGESINQLGTLFGVSPAAIWMVGNRRTWKHVPE